MCLVLFFDKISKDTNLSICSSMDPLSSVNQLKRSDKERRLTDYLYVRRQVETGTNFISQTKSISIPKNHFHQFCFFLQSEMGMGQIYFLIKNLLNLSEICMDHLVLTKGMSLFFPSLDNSSSPTLCEPRHSIVLFSIFILL